MPRMRSQAMIIPVRKEARLYQYQLLMFIYIYYIANQASWTCLDWGCSSVGRARALHARGPDFDYLQLHF